MHLNELFQRKASHGRHHTEFEKGGITKDGAKMITAVSCVQVQPTKENRACTKGSPQRENRALYKAL